MRISDWSSDVCSSDLDPILIDISASITTVNMAQRMIRGARKYPHAWVMDVQGNLSDDPATVTQGGTLLPTGGLDHGQRQEGRSVGKAGVTTCSSRWAPSP